ncbi:hypothetical protein MBLNU13_g00329t1 [Cladosporium sp. NU13]
MADFPCFAPTRPQAGPTMVVSVSVTFACKHSEICAVPYTAGTVPVGFMLNDGHCSADACQKRFINKMRSEAQLAGMNCEASLRRFAMVEPMLKEEMLAAGCSTDIAKALLNCSHRSAAAATYLGHRSLLSSLAEYEQGIPTNAHAMQLIFSHQEVQHKLTAIQSAVLRLIQDSYPAPALTFSRYEGVKSFEQGWGKQELAALKSTDHGRAILALPLANHNILAAKSSMLSAQNELAELTQLQNAERAAFFSDYPGTEALHASGAMMSSQEMLSQASASTTTPQSSSQMDVDDAQDSTFSSADIRSLRPERVLSTSMAAHRRRCPGLDMAKVHAYSSKS